MKLYIIFQIILKMAASLYWQKFWEYCVTARRPLTSQCPSSSMEHNLRVLHLAKKFPAFYVAWGFITMFTRATTYCCPELNELSPWSPILFHYDQFTIILFPMRRSSKWSLSCRLQCLSLSLNPNLGFDKVLYGNVLIIELISAFNFDS
jgi:hypothetical protein